MSLSPPMLLAYCEASMPGESRAERLAWINQHGLALEIANRAPCWIEPYQQARILISAVQAYGMHDFHPIHSDVERRSQALPHVLQTLEMAARLQSPRIVTVCGFGHDLADQPMQRCLDFFGACIPRAKDLGIRIMIEPLSPKRCAAMTHPRDVANLINTLNQSDVFSLMLDTGHLLDSGIELNSFFQAWNEPIEELQLKGPSSAPPTLQMPVKTWINALPTPPAVLSVEHREAIAPQALITLVQGLQTCLGEG